MKYNSPNLTPDSQVSELVVHAQYTTDSQITCFEVFEEKITDKEGKSGGLSWIQKYAARHMGGSKKEGNQWTKRSLRGRRSKAEK